MPTRAQVAILLTALMFSSGCMGLFESGEELPEVIDCEMQPNHPDCVVDKITEEDCRHDQIFTGEECRQIVKPSGLSYGETSISLMVGEEMQALTPAFEGDGPDTWTINPSLPEGLSFDYELGVISGSPTESSRQIRYTILASNLAGSTSSFILIEVAFPAPVSIEYSDSVLDCELGYHCQLAAPNLTGGSVSYWSVEPRLPDGMSMLANGSIEGTPSHLGDSNHTITVSNEAGSVETSVRIIVIHEAPMSLAYGDNRFHLTIGEQIQVIPTTIGGRVVSWEVEPALPDGLQLFDTDGSIRGSPTAVQGMSQYRITATNTGGSISLDILISVKDIPVANLIYTPAEYDLIIDDSISVTPTHSRGSPDSWHIEPNLPSGFAFDHSDGTIAGTATEVQDFWSSYTIWANNTGGSTSTTFRLRIISIAPENITSEQDEYIFAANETAFIGITNDGPDIDTWEVEPSLPTGLSLQSGDILGTPTERSDWMQYTIWANNSGGSARLMLWIAVHDLQADQSDLLRGMGETNWGGWPSPILPIGEWSFPIGFTQEGYGSTIPVISASHVGRGKMLGYGHESWVDGAGEAETEFSLRAVEWVCGENADVGLAYGAGFDEFEDELQAEGHTVHLSVTPSDLSG